MFFLLQTGSRLGGVTHFFSTGVPQGCMPRPLLFSRNHYESLNPQLIISTRNADLGLLTDAGNLES